MSDTLPEMQYRFLGRTGLKVSVISLGSWLTYGGHVGNGTPALDSPHDHQWRLTNPRNRPGMHESRLRCRRQLLRYSRGLLRRPIRDRPWPSNQEVRLEAERPGNLHQGKHPNSNIYRPKPKQITNYSQIYWGKANSANPDKPLNNTGLSRKHIIEGMNLSLQRLDLPYVDVVYAHRPDRDTPMEEIVRGFNYLINNGKTFYWGTSEWSASEISDAWRIADRLGLIGPVVEQPQYNLLARERVEKEYRWLYDAHGLGLTVFSPLKGGVLTGKYNDAAAPPEGSRLAESKDGYVQNLKKTVGDDTWQRQLDQVAALKPVAEELGISTAQLALAWILKNPNISSMITGASRPQQVLDNVKALGAVDLLTEEVIEKIEAAVGNKPVVETRRF